MIFPSNHLTGAKTQSKQNQTDQVTTQKIPKQQLYKNYAEANKVNLIKLKRGLGIF